MALLIKKSKLCNLLKVPTRYSHGPNHWSVLRKKKTHKDKALEHFDDFYAKVYGKSWDNIKTALLQKENKYIAVVNNFSDTERVETLLQNNGAINLKSLYDVFMKDTKEKGQKSKRQKNSSKLSSRIDNIMLERQTSEVRSVYPTDYESSLECLITKEESDRANKIDKPLDPVHIRSIAEDLNNIKQDINRIVLPSEGLSGLYDFMPVTKLKGMEDWVLESKYYEYYSKSSDFEIFVEEEEVLSFPKHLKLYTFEGFSEAKFPPPKKGATDVLDYYLFDGGSILPVLALDVKLGDSVLDMCAAPGGKALTILQTLMPRLMRANDISLHRVKRIKQVFNEYVRDIGQWTDKFFLTHEDARYIEDKGIYTKILVDVPCTTDRHVLHEDDNNIFKPTRIKERLQIPDLQASILVNALKLVSIGGTVVYSTCTLSPIQNDGVVQLALKRIWEEDNSVIVVKDMSKALYPLTTLFNFGNFGLKHGHIVIPTLGYNWGPMYFCKMVKIR